MARLLHAGLVCTALLVWAPAAHGFAIADGPNGFRGLVYSSEAEDDTKAFTLHGTGIYDQAGGHPYKGVVEINLTGTTEDNVDNLRVDIPPGLVPNPNEFPKCSEIQLAGSVCPLDAQIGIEEITASLSGVEINLRLPLYNVEPRPDDVARFGFNPLDVAVIPGIGLITDALGALSPVYIVGGVRDSASIANPLNSGPFQFPVDNGLFFTISDVPETLAVLRSKLTFWGVPRDGLHDAQRRQSCAQAPDLLPIELCFPLTATPNPSPNPEVPFLTNPTRCTGGKLTGRLIVNSGGGASDNRISQTPTIENAQGDPLEGAQECDDVPVDGDVALTPDVTQPDSPSGPAVALQVPQPGLLDRDTLTTSHVEDVSVTLPPGMTINPSAANGLMACTDAQLAAGAGEPGGDACPAASDIGDVSTSSPLLPDDLGGNAYIGQPLSGDMYRLFVTVEGRGVSIRLKGSVKPNPSTGQLAAVFANNPELPFDELKVDFRDGPRAPLATPLDCGPKLASAIFTPWSGTAPKAGTSDPFGIAGSGCPAAFLPTFTAASATSQSGFYSPFTARIARSDRNQFLSRVRVKTPPGLLASISSVTQCPSVQAATGSCPASSRIGTATTRAGAGSEPFQLAGPVYFTGPYKGAPFGMVVAIRAIAGPYDLGTVIVRQSIFVDPNTAALTVVSDPLPTILKGVPIRLRAVDVSLDRQGFVFNPTSCGAKPVASTLYSLQGVAIDRATALGFNGCQALPFTPRMSMRLTGPRQTRFAKHPGLRVSVEQPARKGNSVQANIGKAVVKLPPSLALDPDNARAICSYENGLAAKCQPAARIGTARAISPALNRPLEGPVYFVQGIRIDPTTGNRIRTLPSLLATLRGEIAVNVRGTTAVEGRNLVSTFDRIPDAPVSRFDIDLKGGTGGVLTIGARRGICDRRQVSNAALTGQNAKLAAFPVTMRKPCRRPLLILRRLKAQGGDFVVRGTVRPKATKRISVALRCGSTRVAKAAGRSKPGRWGTALKLRGRCASARKGKLRVSYPGGGDFRIAVRKRTVTLPAGS
jgi:hypothetical protein